MLDYARISKMRAYERAQAWPLNEPLLPAANRVHLVRRGKDIAKILLNYGPITTQYGRGGWPSVFKRGTRGWEYPWVLERISQLPAGARVLDCGCGVSRFPEELYRRGFKPTGLDFVYDPPDPRGNGLTVAHIQRLKHKVAFLDGGMADIPADDCSFDAVTCISVMEHVVIDHKDDPNYHLRCLAEMKRVLKPGGLLICTYDTILNPKVVYGNKHGWGPNGWYYLDDMDYLDMDWLDPSPPRVTREQILLDEDAFFVPPDIYFHRGYGSGFDLSDSYHRLTSVGFALVKR